MGATERVESSCGRVLHACKTVPQYLEVWIGAPWCACSYCDSQGLILVSSPPTGCHRFSEAYICLLRGCRPTNIEACPLVHYLGGLKYICRVAPATAAVPIFMLFHRALIQRQLWHCMPSSCSVLRSGYTSRQSSAPMRACCTTAGLLAG